MVCIHTCTCMYFVRTKWWKFQLASYMCHEQGCKFSGNFWISGNASKGIFFRIWKSIHVLNKIINAPCGTLKLLLALGVAKYIKSYKIHFVVQYATDYCPLEHNNYKTISAHLGSPISCYINNLHGAFIFLLSVYRQGKKKKKEDIVSCGRWKNIKYKTKIQQTIGSDHV